MEGGTDSDEGLCDTEEDFCDMLSEDSGAMEEYGPIWNCDGISRHSWSGMLLYAKNANDNVFARVFIISSHPLACMDGQEVLGMEDVGIVVVEELDGDHKFENQCLRWPMRQLFSTIDERQPSVYDHDVVYKRQMKDKEEKGVIVQKRRYNYKKRKETRNRKVEKARKMEKLLSLSAINTVYSKECCVKNCTRKFSPETIRLLRTEMHLQSFKARTSMNLQVHRQIHRDVRNRRTVVTVEGKEVCLTAWGLLHNISKRTFQRYQNKAKRNERGGPHGNLHSKKPRVATKQAKETLRAILECSADQMPHSQCTLPTGERVGKKVLPSGVKWRHLLIEVNKVNASLNLPVLSQASFSRIRTKWFSDYVLKKRGDSFSRCSTCDKLKSIRSMYPPNSEDYNRTQHQFQSHLYEQEACRHAYYASRAISVRYPSKLLCIMHDKMDHSKTASPCFARKSKAHDGLMKLPLRVTGMFAHGHGDKKYAHYHLDVFKSDSNFTVGSVAKLLRDVESTPAVSSRVLFRSSGNNVLYRALLHGKEACIPSLGEPPATIEEARPLPPILHVQMDNCWKDNKNRYVFCFWSLLVARRIVKEVVVSFMMVGHTHDDIDASFGRWSMLLHENDYPTLPLLMKSYMDLEAGPVIPHLVEEVPDFKAFIAPFIIEHAKELVGHSKGRQYKFFIDDNDWPIMQFKLSCTKKEWGPAGGIKLWRSDSNGRPLLPIGQPHAVKPHKMKQIKDVLKGLKGFVKLWQDMYEEEMHQVQKDRLLKLSEYWDCVQKALETSSNNDVEGFCALQNGFWPTTRQPVLFSASGTEYSRVEEDVESNEPYIGPLDGRPPPCYNVAIDACKGFMLFVRPAQSSLEPVWMGMAMEDPQFDPQEDHYREVVVQWYKPAGTERDAHRLYAGWDTKNQFKWDQDTSSKRLDYISTDSIMASWKPRHSTTGLVGAPKKQVRFAVDNLRRIAEAERLVEENIQF